VRSRRYRIPEIDVNTATLELADGRLADAVLRLRSALAARPDDGRARMLLATTLAAHPELRRQP
jgi:Flp pilus assembly protein TadD